MTERKWAVSKNNTWHKADPTEKHLWADCRQYALDRPIKLSGPAKDAPPAGATICRQCGKH